MTDTYTILQLTPLVGAGLVTLSAVLSFATFFAAHRAHKAAQARISRYRLIPHITIAAALFWLFMWLSPQVYYLFYMACLPGLPAQIVIGWPPFPARLMQLLWIDFSADLPPIAQGLLGWTLLGQAISYTLPGAKTQ